MFASKEHIAHAGHWAWLQGSNGNDKEDQIEFIYSSSVHRLLTYTGSHSLADRRAVAQAAAGAEILCLH